MTKAIFIPIIFCLAIAFTACKGGKKEIPNSMVTGKATIAADEALKPLVNAELDVFHSLYDFASVNCEFISEYDAVNLLLQEKIRLALVTRPFNQKEIEYFRSIKINPESILLGYDAIAIITPNTNQTKNLTTLQISKILSGEISDWSQIGESGIKGSVKVVFDTESSGIIRALNDSLQLNKKISGDLIFAGNNKKVAETIISTPNAIGFVGYNWLSETDNLNVQKLRSNLRIIAVSKNDLSVTNSGILPSAYNLFNLNYPLIRKVYALYTDPAASLARGFLAHLTSEKGMKIIYRVGLKPEHDFQREIHINKQ
jgi:phosphate transport system substrate-binding protein